jgi:hypothetical protein
MYMLGCGRLCEGHLRRGADASPKAFHAMRRRQRLKEEMLALAF